MFEEVEQFFQLFAGVLIFGIVVAQLRHDFSQCAKRGIHLSSPAFAQYNAEHFPDVRMGLEVIPAITEYMYNSNQIPTLQFMQAGADR